ncbi:hypothetical protein AVEN_165340-1 [Araneus ventricosus]|uniref:Uncharacterized protein n=1 Tax=Araneus ventricosus TaxID=182803 RepID=A0A4Y2ASZ2_ARAVE|nr:hypothetical protein AVEN_165340-1 [Araneus ventricosus]
MSTARSAVGGTPLLMAPCGASEAEHYGKQLLKIMRFIGGRGGLVVRSRPRDRRVAGSKPDSTEDPPCMGPVAR